MHTFSLEGEEYIELNKLLKLFNLVESGGEANNLITEGAVKVNGETETRKRRKMRPGDSLFFNKKTVKVVE